PSRRQRERTFGSLRRGDGRSCLRPPALYISRCGETRMTKQDAEPLFPSLDQRSRDIFRLVVESYLQHGEPLGSRNLSRLLPSQLSPATVRNVMSDLEHLGLVYSPHVSAGRLPTQQGLRFFVDAFMEMGDVSEEERRVI